MTLLKRRLIFALLFLVFFLGGPAIVLYAAGYRLNIKQGRIERVGLLHVTTDPDDSQMILDGILYEIGKEIVLKSLQPKRYEIILTKEGYHSWIKNIDILPGQSTILREIKLIQKSDPVLISEQKESKSVAVRANQVLLQQGANLLIQTTAGEPQSVPMQSAHEMHDLRFNTDGSMIAFSQNGTWFTADLLTEKIQEITTDLPVQQIEFASSLILLLTPQEIWTYNPASQTEGEQLWTISLPQLVKSKSDGYWIISTEPARQRSFLYETSGLSGRPRLVATLPYAQTYEMIRDSNGFITLLDRAAKKAVLVDTRILPPRIEVLEGVHKAVWNADGTQLLTATDYEITIHHFTQGRTQELILRISTPLRDVAWHPEERHVFYTTDDGLFLVERDGISQRNIFALNRNASYPEFVMTSKETIRFLSTPAGTVQIWELAL